MVEAAGVEPFRADLANWLMARSGYQGLSFERVAAPVLVAMADAVHLTDCSPTIEATAS